MDYYPLLIEEIVSSPNVNLGSQNPFKLTDVSNLLSPVLYNA